MKTVITFLPSLLRTCIITAAIVARPMTLHGQSAWSALEIGKVGVTPISIDAISLHPPLRRTFYCGEHTVGDFLGLGDAFGKDCLSARPLSGAGPDAPYVFYRGNGRRNEDWYTLGDTVLAPFDGVVDFVYVNSEANKLGRRGSGPGSMVVFIDKDGTRVLYVHLQSISVDSGQMVRRGSAVGTVGNNGLSRNPHVHIGAWRGLVPLQITFDLLVKSETVSPNVR